MNEASTEYRKQRNICVHLLGRVKRNPYNAPGLINVTNNRKFWKTIRLFFTNKIKAKNKVKDLFLPIKLKLKTKLLLVRIVNLLNATKKWITILALSLRMLHLTLSYPTINHYLGNCGTCN